MIRTAEAKEMHTMRVAEGVRRIFIVIGCCAALTTAVVGYSERPTEATITGSTSTELLRILASKYGLESGFELRRTVFEKWSDAAIVTDLCRAPTDPGINLICATHNDQRGGLFWASVKHFVAVFFYASLAFASSLLACSVLIWIGRGFMPTPVQPPK